MKQEKKRKKMKHGHKLSSLRTKRMQPTYETKKHQRVVSCGLAALWAILAITREFIGRTFRSQRSDRRIAEAHLRVFG